MNIKRLSKWYGAIVWLVFAVVGALVVSALLGGTEYAQHWLGSIFKVTSGAWLGHWIARDLLGSPDELTPALPPAPTLAQVADGAELVPSEFSIGVLSGGRNLLIGRAILIASAMLGVCLAI